MTDRVVALVPCKDGENAIAETVMALAGEPSIDEVVVIDDGSSDATTDRALDAGARVVRCPDNLGKAGALKAGVDATPEADVYLLVDADTRATAAETVHLLPQVLRDEADLVIGVLPSANGRGGFGLVKDVAAKGIHRATGFELQAPLSGQRAIRADLLRKLELAPRFGVEVGMTIDAINSGARVTEREVAMEHQHHGKTFSGFLHRGKQGWDVVAALRPRVIPGAYRLALLIVVTAFLLGLMLSSSESGSLGVNAGRTHALPKVNEVDVIVVPNWSWDDVITDGETVKGYPGLADTLDPAQPALIGSIATGDVKDIVRAVQLGTRDDAATGTNDVKVRVRPKGIIKEETYSRVRIVMGVTLKNQTPELRPVVMQGVERSGSFASSSTKRPGIVDLTDIAPTVQWMEHGAVPAGEAQPLRALDTAHAIENAKHTNDRIRFYDKHRPLFIVVYVVAQVAMYAYAFFLRKREKPTPFLNHLAVLIAAVPLSAMLTQWLLSHRSPHGVAWSASFAATTAIIVGMSGLASRSTTTPIRRVLAATIFVFVADIFTGAHLQLGGFFGSSPALGARYYGLGNVASALLLIATVLWCTLHIKSGEAIGPNAKRSAWWRALAVAVLVAFVIGTPGLGSDVGGLFTSVVIFSALFAALWKNNGLDWSRVTVIAVAGIILVVLAAIADAHRAAGSQTHLGRLAARVADDGPSPLWHTIAHKVDVNLFGYGFPWSVLLLAMALAMLVELMRGRWAGTLPKNSCERIGAIAALIGSAVAYGVNDSGIVTLVLVAVFLGPFLMVLHRQNRWGIPKLEVRSP